MIKVENLSKSFGPVTALRSVNLSVAEGEFVVVVGPNGAGKTTLVRILATLSRMTTGRVSLGGHTLPAGAIQARRQIGFVGHQPLLYGDLSAEENLIFYGRLYGVSDLAARVTQTLEMLGLTHRRRELVRTFSRGMQQRLAIARAVLHQPRVLLLDEPYTGLDQDAAARLEQMLSSAGRRGCTVVMTTHDLERGLALADRVVILARGRVAFQAQCSETNSVAFMQAYQRVTQCPTPATH